MPSNDRPCRICGRPSDAKGGDLCAAHRKRLQRLGRHGHAQVRLYIRSAPERVQVASLQYANVSSEDDVEWLRAKWRLKYAVRRAAENMSRTKRHSPRE